MRGGFAMAKAIEKKELIDAAIEILEKEPEGLRTRELCLERLWPKFHNKGLAGAHGMLVDYASEPGAKIYQPRRGWFRLSRFRESQAASDAAQAPSEKVAEKIAEGRFYEPFANWLEEQQECTRATVVGGAKMRDKWGTPDVVGIVKPRLDDIIRPPIEIVSAEIKVSTDGLITAFGQACAYKLFSHKSYIAIPRTSSPEDSDKLEALCFIFNIGLVLFDATSTEDPKFEMVARARKSDPDIFYVNQKIKLLKELLK
jgi:hypothetical protein